MKNIMNQQLGKKIKSKPKPKKHFISYGFNKIILFLIANITSILFCSKQKIMNTVYNRPGRYKHEIIILIRP